MQSPRNAERHPAWRPGQSANPAGRPKGARNRIGEGFLAALCADFADHGPRVIEAMRRRDPVAYVKVCASILPCRLDADPVRQMSDAEIEAALRLLLPDVLPLLPVAA